MIRVEDFVAKKKAEYPVDPACDVCNGAQDSVMTHDQSQELLVHPDSRTLQLYG